MKKTKIDWCDSSWNPVTGCYHGCKYCYARGIANRFSRPHCTAIDVPVENTPRELHELDRPFTATKNGKEKTEPYPFAFLPTLHRYRLNEYEKKKGRTIFVCSMADLFGDWVPDQWIEEVFAACDRAPQHRYLFLTKNPKRYAQLANAGKLPKWKDNWWFGSTVTDKDSRMFGGSIYWNTFVSVEPLLEPLDVGLGSFGCTAWIIIGAETGKRKDKVIPEKAWVDNICKAAALTRAAVFMKNSLLPIMGEENMRREYPWK